MTIKKKKARKKRVPKQYEIPQTEEEKRKVQYRDDFQKTLGHKLEDLAEKLAGKGRVIMYAAGALVAIAIIAGLFYMQSQRTANTAQAALGKAIETSRARITDAPLPAGATEKTFKTKKERAEAAIKEFKTVADTYGGTYAEKANYFIALNRLDIDRAAGTKELEGLMASSNEVGTLSKFALAQIRVEDGKLDDGAKLYNELLKVADPVVSKVTLKFALAGIYEKQSKTKEAAALYFEIAKAASEAKDSDDKPVPMTATETEAKAKLEELDPEKAKEIKTDEPTPAGMPPGILN